MECLGTPPNSPLVTVRCPQEPSPHRAFLSAADSSEISHTIGTRLTLSELNHPK